jgi:hypothetical protein
MARSIPSMDFTSSALGEGTCEAKSCMPGEIEEVCALAPEAESAVVELCATAIPARSRTIAKCFKMPPNSYPPAIQSANEDTLRTLR